MNTKCNPFARYMPLYQEAGWEVLPLPYGKKKTPPTGTTGLSGQPLTEDEIFDYAQKSHNIAVRLPETLIGIDIDERHGGFATFAELEDTLGLLPEGWFGFTSQENPWIDGFTMFFRVPAGYRFHDGAGEGIDIIQRSYRYSVAAGSVLEDGRSYRLINEEGQGLPMDLLPSPEEAPELPKEWFEFLKKEELVTTFREQAEQAVVLSPTEGTCAYMEAILARRLGMLTARKESRHSLLRDASWAMIKEAGKGHHGAEAALEVYLQAWRAAFTAVEKKLPRGRGMEQEIRSLIENARKSTEAPKAPCACGSRKAIELTAWDRKWIAAMSPAQRVAAQNPHLVPKAPWGATLDTTGASPEEDALVRQAALEEVAKEQERTRARSAAKERKRKAIVAEAERVERERATVEAREPKKVKAGLYGPAPDDLVASTTATFARRSPEEMAEARKVSIPRERTPRPLTMGRMGYNGVFGR